MQVLIGNVDFGAQIQAGLGIAAEDVQASEVVLVTILIDDSGSIRFGNNAQLVRDGHNTVVDSLQGAKQKDGVLIATSYLNGTVLYPYRKIVDAEKMDAKNFNPNGSTPLYDRAIVLCGQVIAKTKEFEDSRASRALGRKPRGVSMFGQPKPQIDVSGYVRKVMTPRDAQPVPGNYRASS